VFIKFLVDYTIPPKTEPYCILTFTVFIIVVPYGTLLSLCIHLIILAIRVASTQTFKTLQPVATSFNFIVPQIVRTMVPFVGDCDSLIMVCAKEVVGPIPLLYIVPVPADSPPAVGGTLSEPKKVGFGCFGCLALRICYLGTVKATISRYSTLEYANIF
jgi:hypothetical protein